MGILVVEPGLAETGGRWAALRVLGLIGALGWAGRETAGGSRGAGGDDWRAECAWIGCLCASQARGMPSRASQPERAGGAESVEPTPGGRVRHGRGRQQRAPVGRRRRRVDRPEDRPENRPEGRPCSATRPSRSTVPPSSGW